MKYRTRVEIRCSSLTNANNVRTTVANFLAGKSIFAQDKAPVAVQEGSEFFVRADIRFNTRGDADTLRTQIVTNWTTNSRVLASSRINTHNCGHDEGQGLCTIDAESVK